MALSRRRKLLLVLVVLPLLLVALLVAALFTPAVQTFATRKALAGQGGSVERVAAGLGGAEVTRFTIEQPGLRLVVPSLRADAPLTKVAGGMVQVRSLVAHDILIEIDPAAQPATPADPAPTETPSKPFDGLLNAAQLPVLDIEGIDLSGRLRVAGAQPVDATFTLTGGGIRAGQTGELVLKVEAQSELGSVVTTFTVSPKLGADGRLDALGAVVEALAQGKLLAQPSRLRATADIARQSVGESYALRLLANDATLAELDTRWAPGAGEVPGRWKISLRDRDLAPFVMGLALPDFALTGGGELAFVGTDKLRLGGALDVSADGLEVLGLPQLGPVAATTSFALESGAGEVRVESLKLDVKGATPVLAIETRQPFSFALETRKLAAARAGADLAEIRLLGVPAEWLRLFVPDLSLSGPITGAWTARPEGDGFLLTSSQPLVAPGLVYASAGKPLAIFDSVRVEDLRVKQTSAGLDASLGRLRAVAGGVDVVALKLEATQKPGGPMQAKGELRALLARLADQPMLRGQTRLSAGEAVVTFDASVAEALKALAQLRLTGLRANGADLPELTLDAEVARDAAGVLVAKLPLSVRNAALKRASDLLLEATLTPGKDVNHVAAKLSSQVLFVPDLQLFAAIAAPTSPAPSAPPAPPAPPAPGGAPKPAAPSGPLWEGTTGELELALARIVYAPGLESNAIGRLALTREAASLEKVQAILGSGGKLDVQGALRWVPAAKNYTLGADVKGADVAVGPLLKAFQPDRPAPLEGVYNLTATVAGQGAEPGAALSGAAAEVKLTGKRGALRALNLDTNKYARAGNVVSGLAGIAGALSGNNEISQRANQITAFNDFARSLANLPYDEITLEAKRAPDGSVEIAKLDLLSPQLRLAGAGGLRAVAGRSFGEMPLNLRLELGARGDIARYLAALRVLAPADAEAPADAFRQMKEPLLLGGTPKRIDTSQITRLLTEAIGL
jgi:hypothetical protein